MCTCGYPHATQRFKIPQFVDVDYMLKVKKPDKKVMELCLAEWFHKLA
jgi:hypothetical protein